jgi:hypothetical protein
VGFANVAALVDAEEAGKIVYATFRKVPAVATVQGVWYDYSMAPGKPGPQYYAATPLEHAPLSRSADGGLDHGASSAPATKYLRRMMLMNVTTGTGSGPQRVIVLDYIAFVPFIDMGTSDIQSVLNPTYELPRHSDGEGVQMMAVLVAPHSSVGDTFVVTYTNQDGTTGRTTPAHTMTTGAAVNGILLTTQSSGAGRFGPFLTLAAGDTGVRAIESVQCAAGTDVGLFTLVLVKPIADLMIRGQDAPVEVDFYTERGGSLPALADDAYVNMICLPVGTLASRPTLGLATFIWE